MKFQTYFDRWEHPGVDFTVEEHVDGKTIRVPELSRTKQSFAEECDINNIVRKAAKNGFTPPDDGNRFYGDFSESVDYRSALDLIMDAQRQFDDLPSNVRARFANDPANFLDFVHNPENAEELVKMGLATLREPVATPVAPPTAPASPKGAKPAKKPESGSTSEE